MTTLQFMFTPFSLKFSRLEFNVLVLVCVRLTGMMHMKLDCDRSSNSFLLNVKMFRSYSNIFSALPSTSIASQLSAHPLKKAVKSHKKGLQKKTNFLIFQPSLIVLRSALSTFVYFSTLSRNPKQIFNLSSFSRDKKNCRRFFHASQQQINENELNSVSGKTRKKVYVLS